MKPIKILICGLSGSGKTTLAKQLSYHFLVPHHNADTYREYYNDYDMSKQGRYRQAQRMSYEWGILDFICPTAFLRQFVEADYTIWMDTIDNSKYPDTDLIFEPVVEENVIRIDKWISQEKLAEHLVNFNPGIKGMLSFLNDCMPSLGKMQ